MGCLDVFVQALLGGVEGESANVGVGCGFNSIPKLLEEDFVDGGLGGG